MSFGNTVSKKGTGLVLGRVDAMQSDCLWKAATVHVDVILRVFSAESNRVTCQVHKQQIPAPPSSLKVITLV